LSATRPTTSSKSSLPTQPSLEHLRKEAKQRLAKLRAGGASVQLTDAQLVLAREYGFSSWRALKAAVEIGGTYDAYCGPPLNQHRIASSRTAILDRAGLESAFFSFIALAMFLTCMAMTVDFGIHKTISSPDPVVVNVEILH
jgi:hypothetical protein